MTKSKFTNRKEIERVEFLNFDETPEIEIEFRGEKTLTIEGEKKTFRTAVDLETGELFIVPNNVQLRMLTDDIKEGEQCKIVYKGLKKIEGSKNKVKEFEVYTA